MKKTIPVCRLCILFFRINWEKWEFLSLIYRRPSSRPKCFFCNERAVRKFFTQYLIKTLVKK